MVSYDFPQQIFFVALRVEKAFWFSLDTLSFINQEMRETNGKKKWTANQSEMTEKNVIKSKFVLTIISYSFFKAAQLLQFSSLLHLNLSFFQL